MQVRTLPYADDIEEAVLGGLISYPKELSVCEPYLNEEEIWGSPKCWTLYRLIKQLKYEKVPVDLLSVCNRLTADHKVMGMDAYWISGLNEKTGASGSLEYYEKYLQRKVITSTKKIEEKIYNKAEDVFETIMDTHTALGEMIEMRPTEKFNIEETLDKTIDSITSSRDNIISTSYTNIDKLAGGFTKGEITIVGGRPGHGKTTFCLNLLSNFLNQGMRVCLVNREMPNHEMMKKILCLESQELSYRMIRKGLFDNLEDLAKLNKAKELIKERYGDRLAMFDNLKDFHSSASEIKKFKPDVVIDDYIQLIEPERNIDQRRLQLERICNQYKWLAKSQECVVVIASQLNRMLEMRQGKDTKPKLSDLAESGAIEQVAENVLFVHYDYKLKGSKSKLGENKIQIVAQKCRYGTTGEALLRFDGDKCSMYNVEEW